MSIQNKSTFIVEILPCEINEIIAEPDNQVITYVLGEASQENLGVLFLAVPNSCNYIFDLEVYGMPDFIPYTIGSTAMEFTVPFMTDSPVGTYYVEVMANLAAS